MFAVPPVIIRQPRHVASELGQTVCLRVVAQGSQPLKYEWFKDAKLMDEDMTDTLILRYAKHGETNGMYTCRVSNLYGNAISEFASVTVTGTNTC